MKRAVFFDRDGTLVHDGGYTYRIGELQLLEGVVPALRLLMMLKFRLIVVTNQSGIARGLFTEDDMHAFNGSIAQQLAASGVKLDAIYFCPFHPDASEQRYRHDSHFRKPKPGMLELAAAEHGLNLAECFMIGDKKSDVLAGQAAGCRTILVQTGAAGTGEPDLAVQPDWTAPDLLAAAQIIAQGIAPAKTTCRV
jgi:D-glycero-D-manno-heptose 1,7-bisphosphate phosphatase